ncbi:MAG TPA: hemolysin family protein [Dehalococcoidia bacterium]|nr:hemolysin family protein [Dehalococcoidia bacterium]
MSLLLFGYLNLAQHSEGAGGKLSPRAGAALLLLRDACVIAAALSGLALAQTLLPGDQGVGWRPIAVVGVSLLVALTATHRLARAAATHQPAWAARRSGPLLRVLEQPLMSGRPGGGRRASGKPTHTAPEQVDALPPLEELAGMDQRDRQMLRSILRLDETTAREVMVPRLDMVAVERHSTLEEVVQLMIESGHNRLPVYEGTLDQIVGVVHLRDLMAQRGRNLSPSELWRPPFFVPETKRLDGLLEELQEQVDHMAIVVDEYGGTAGVVTLRNLLEEIVGEIEDDASRSREPQAVQLPDGAVMVDARVALEDIGELFDTRIEAPGVGTVGGYVYQALDRIPQVGDVVVMDHLSIEVASVQGPRLMKVRIRRGQDNPAGSNGNGSSQNHT